MQSRKIEKQLKLVPVEPTIAEEPFEELEEQPIDDFADLAIDIERGRIEDERLYRRTAEQRAKALDDRISRFNTSFRASEDATNGGHSESMKAHFGID
jgi:hypothetical protein